MTNWYREALEAVGMLGRRKAIRNRLNAVAAHSDDAALRTLATEVIREFDYAGLNTDHTSLLDSNSVNTDKLVTHCQERAYS